MTAWLIERSTKDGSQSMVPEYLGVQGSYGHEPSGLFFWTAQHLYAIQFRRQIDAQLTIGAIRLMADYLPHGETIPGLRSGDPPPKATEHASIE